MADNEVDYKLWVNKERTVLVRFWSDGQVEVALRDHSSDTWGPPIWVTEERVVRA